MPTVPPLHPYQILSNHLKQYASYGLHKIVASRNNEKSELSLLHVTCLLVLLFISTNIIKICLKVYRSYQARKDASTDFFFRGGNYIMKKVRVVSLAWDTPTGPPLHSYQILWNYLKQYGSYGLLILTRGDNYITQGESCLSCRQHAYWSFSSFLPNVIKIYLRVSKLWSAQGFLLQGR